MHDAKEAIEIARCYIFSAPTFKFDGIQSSFHIKLLRILKRKPPIYIIQADFICAHPGYGDRTGSIIPQIITNHIILVDVFDGKITSAIIDEQWDEMNQIDSTDS